MAPESCQFMAQGSVRNMSGCDENTGPKQWTHYSNYGLHYQHPRGGEVPPSTTEDFEDSSEDKPKPKRRSKSELRRPKRKTRKRSGSAPSSVSLPKKRVLPKDTKHCMHEFLFENSRIGKWKVYKPPAMPKHMTARNVRRHKRELEKKWQEDENYLRWKTFEDDDYADWETFSEYNTEVPAVSFFSMMQVKHHPTTVGNANEKVLLADIVKERLIHNAGATTRIWIGRNPPLRCISNLLKCYSVWFANRDWRLTRFFFGECSVPLKGFESLYLWMRTQELPNLERSVPTLQASRHLKVPILEEKLWKIVSNPAVQERGAFNLFKLARDMSMMNEFKDAMLQRMRNYFLPLVGSDDFLDLHVDIVEELLRRDNLGVNTEMEIFFSVLRWVGHRPHRVQERIPHLQRLMDCVRFHYIPTSMLYSLRETCQRPDKRDLFRPDPVLMAFNSDPQSLLRMEDALAFIALRCQYNTDELMQTCHQHNIHFVYPRRWQYHRKCSYHLPKLSFPYKHKFTACDFEQYVTSLQDSWQGDGPEDNGRSEMVDMEPDALSRERKRKPKSATGKATGKSTAAKKKDKK